PVDVPHHPTFTIFPYTTLFRSQVDIDKLRAYKDGVIKTMTGGLAGMAKGRKVNVVQGVGRFLSPNHIEVVASDGGKKVVQFQKADRKSTRLNSSHDQISYAVFC